MIPTENTVVIALRGQLEVVAGVLLMVVVLLDVFFTVLYARAGTGIVSPQLSRAVGSIFRTVSRLFGDWREAVLSLCGPTILVLLVALWAITLSVAAALMIHPYLGTSVQAQSGRTPTDFITALYAGGSSISIVGSGSFSPQTAAFKLIYLFNSLVGVSVVSLTLTYLMQVYSALHSRNSLGLSIDLASGRSGDAAELIAALGPGGRFDGGYSNLSNIAQSMTETKESHHFYPVLMYFRFPDPYYSVSRFTLVSLDAITLIETALSKQEYSWLQQSAAVQTLWGAATLLLDTLSGISGRDEHRKTPDARQEQLWRQRYFAALARLQAAKIRTTENAAAGADAYVRLRRQWAPYVSTLGPALGYSPDEIDPAMTSIDMHEQAA